MREQVLKLQRRMRELGIDVYVVSDIDEHLSEYVSEHFHALEEYSGFTGGDGKLVVTAGRADAGNAAESEGLREGAAATAGNADASEGNGAGKAALWTDGRYFTQAENQLAGSGLELMRMGEPETPLMNVPEAAIVAEPLLKRFEAAGEEYISKMTLSPETVAELERPMISAEEYLRNVNGTA